MHAKTFLTPTVCIDGVTLAFCGPLDRARASEAFATLLTFATFDAKREEVVMEAYEGRHVRMDEDAWYGVAQEYYGEYLEMVRTATDELRAGLAAWLAHHFFSRYRGYEALEQLIGELAAMPQQLAAA